MSNFRIRRYGRMKIQANMVRTKVNVKLKFLVLQTKRAYRIMILLIIIIRKQIKKMKLYCRLIMGSSPVLASIYLLPMPKLQINQFPVEHQARIERVISKSSLDVIHMTHEPMAKIKCVVPEYPKRKISSSNLFGQGQKLRGGGDPLDLVNELDKVSFRTVYSPEFLRYIFQDPERTKRFINFILYKNLLTLQSIYQNLPSEVKQLFLSELPKVIKYLGYLRTLNSMRFPAAEGFQPNIPQYRQLGAEPGRHSLGLWAKPKLSEKDLRAMLNKPADLASVKLQVDSKIFLYDNLTKEAQKTLGDPLNRKTADALIEQYRSGNKNPGIGTEAIPGTKLFELRGKYGTRVIMRVKDGIINVVAICNKKNQTKVFEMVRKIFGKK
jgi:hypothetical protein